MVKRQVTAERSGTAQVLKKPPLDTFPGMDMHFLCHNHHISGQCRPRDIHLKELREEATETKLKDVILHEKLNNTTLSS